MKFQVLKTVVHELVRETQDLKESIYGVFEKLSRGEKIPMPLCRPVFSIEKGLYELRFSYQAGEYRVFYYIKRNEALYVIHAMQKKTQKIPARLIDLLKTRIRSLG